MEELIELLNEHIEENTGQKYYLNERDVKDKLDSLLILRYFIKWLVDNDKIERDRILKENGQFRMFYHDLERVKNYDRLVMYLSVEDNPIEFLISVLK